MINAPNSENGRKIRSNGESGLQKKYGTEPVAVGWSENGTDAESCAECRAVVRADTYAVPRAENRADLCAEKNGTDANSFADAEPYADVRAGLRAEVCAELRADAGVDDGKKSVWNINCTILIQ
jgi:hypothetical protein